MTAPRTEDEWDVFRRQVEVQLDEYEHAVRDAAAWWRAYQERNKGFRAMRRKAGSMLISGHHIDEEECRRG